ncbi:MAG: glycosyltransferase family 4 protein [Oligoflexia bacterium]|nr:glycosyltransferase family 4 protein [Oligoflexia bacterium]
MSIRILGLSMERTADFSCTPAGKNAGLFLALDERYPVVDIVYPQIGRPERWIRQLAHFHPDRATWRKRYNLDPRTFERRSALAGRTLSLARDRFDLIVQLHALVGPGHPPGPWPFVLHTDNSYLLSQRHYPPWAPLRGRARDRRLALEREVFHSAAFIFPRSDWLARSLVADQGCDPGRVIRVGGGVNFRVPDRLERRYDQQVALFVGLEFDRKGGRVLLAAWERVRSRLPHARLQIVGPKRPHTALPPGVEWVGPLWDRAALRARYLDATLFVMPSLFEPWGHAFLEAMSQGLPCIGARCCAMPEIIDDGRTGLLVPPGEALPLAAALESLLGDPGRAAAMGAAAHAQVLAQHGWERVVDTMAPYLEEAAQGGGQGGGQR